MRVGDKHEVLGFNTGSCHPLHTPQVGGIDEVIAKADKLVKDVASRKESAAKGKVSWAGKQCSILHCA